MKTLQLKLDAVLDYLRINSVFLPEVDDVNSAVYTKSTGEVQLYARFACPCFVLKDGGIIDEQGLDSLYEILLFQLKEPCFTRMDDLHKKAAAALSRNIINEPKANREIPG